MNMRRIDLHLRSRIFILALAGMVVLFCMATGLMADEGAGDSGDTGAWQIDADQIDYDQKKDEFYAHGAVRISRQNRTLEADRVRLNQTTGDASADGSVRLVSGEDLLTGDHLEMNLNSETGLLTDGRVFISKNHMYLSGREIQKTGPWTYAADRISLTSCDGDDPAWHLTGSDFKVTIEGYGSAKHTALWAGNIPILYSPYLFFPVKIKRQSGLLMPEFGYSDRKGSQYLQPLFWAINDSSDATFYAHFMSQRGLRSGIEYRYVLDEASMGALFAEGYEDSKIDDGQQDNTRRWGYEGDAELRENTDRYWFRMKHDHRLGGGVNAKLDLDVVSDQDYLHEFRSGYNGFNATRDYFQETFGRDIDDYNDPIRMNRLNLNRIWNQYSFNGDLRWYDDVVKRRQGTENQTLQQLPALTLVGIKQPIGRSPLYYDLNTSYTHFYRINGTRGQRVDVYPRTYVPFDVAGAFSVEPSVGVRGTAWHIDHYETRPDHDRDDLARAIYDFRLDISTELFRIFDFDIGGCDKLKHAVTPEITYEYTPEVDQSSYPNFDAGTETTTTSDQISYAVDRIERKNLITYGITNTFTARTPGWDKNQERQYAYTPFLRFKLSQSFDINKHNEDDPRPFSDFLAELDLTPGHYVGIDTDAQWSIYDNEFKEFSTAMSLWDPRGDRLTADYRYTRETSEAAMDGIQTLRLEAEFRLTDRWLLRGAYEENIYNQIEIERTLGFSYLGSCWGMTADYGFEQDNHRFNLMFNLAGLGDIDG
jgi:LPS-assembly protein